MPVHRCRARLGTGSRLSACLWLCLCILCLLQHLAFELVHQQLLGRLAQHHLLRLSPPPPRNVRRALERRRRAVKHKHRAYLVEQQPASAWKPRRTREPRGRFRLRNAAGLQHAALAGEGASRVRARRGCTWPRSRAQAMLARHCCPLPLPSVQSAPVFPMGFFIQDMRSLQRRTKGRNEACGLCSPTDATEEAAQVCILDHLAALIAHRLHELEQPDGCIYSTGKKAGERPVRMCAHTSVHACKCDVC
eukprot:355589-Chlamydomonas_euryale.AAC.4